MHQSSCLSLPQIFSPTQAAMGTRFHHFCMSDYVKPNHVRLQVKPTHNSFSFSQCQRHSPKLLRTASISKRLEDTHTLSLGSKISQRCAPIKSVQDYASDLNDNNWRRFGDTVREKLHALYMFSRPHTIYGTLIGITSVSLLPIQSVADLSPAFFIGLLKALVPSILMNVYVVGLNQLFDVEIDKINKPELPLARGDFSMGTGATIVFTFLVMSLAMGIKFQSPPLFYALLISCLLGSVYSIELPLMRWKKHAVLAATCILIVRAVVVQVAFFIHIQKYVLGRPIAFTRSLVFGVAFMCFFSTVIALFKDIPDVEGDRDFGIQSFSVNLGKERVFWLCVNMLLTAYGAAVVVGLSSPFMLQKLVIVVGHLALASLLLLRAQSIDLTSKTSITRFYMFIWKLFYAEYFLVPFIR